MSASISAQSVSEQAARKDSVYLKNIDLMTKLANERAKVFVLEEKLKRVENAKLRTRIKRFLNRFKKKYRRPKTVF